MSLREQDERCQFAPEEVRDVPREEPTAVQKKKTSLQQPEKDRAKYPGRLRLVSSCSANGDRHRTTRAVRAKERQVGLLADCWCSAGFPWPKLLLRDVTPRPRSRIAQFIIEVLRTKYAGANAAYERLESVDHSNFPRGTCTCTRDRITVCYIFISKQLRRAGVDW